MQGPERLGAYVQYGMMGTAAGHYLGRQCMLIIERILSAGWLHLMAAAKPRIKVYTAQHGMIWRCPVPDRLYAFLLWVDVIIRAWFYHSRGPLLLKYSVQPTLLPRPARQETARAPITFCQFLDRPDLPQHQQEHLGPGGQ